MHCDAISITHITHANIYPCIYSHNLNQTNMSYNFTFPYTKISSLELIIKHEQFNLNFSIKHIFTQNFIFVNTVSGTVKPLVTVPFKTQIIGSLCEPEFHGHFRPQTNQYMIYFTNYTINNPNKLHSAHTVTAYPFWVKKIYNNKVPRFGTDQTAPHGL